MGKLSIDLRKLVVRKVAEGWSQRTISKYLNIFRCAVQNIIKIKAHGTIENLHKIGRPRMNSERTVRVIVLYDYDSSFGQTKTFPIAFAASLFARSNICEITFV